GNTIRLGWRFSFSNTDSMNLMVSPSSKWKTRDAESQFLSAHCVYSSLDSCSVNPDYHMHTPLCRHATGHPAEYAREAMRKGLPEIGFSDHSPMPEPFDDWRMDIGDLPRYFELVDEAREKTPGFPIRLGLECDYFPGQEDWIQK